MPRRLVLVSIVIGALAPPLPPALAAQGDTSPWRSLPDSQEAVARDIASNLRCPVCLNLSVEDSPSELARDMKQLIRDMVADGRSREEIRGYFVGRYGEWVLLTPEPQGFNLLVWLLPAAVLLGGGAIVWGAVRRWTRSAGEAPVAEDDEYLRKVREELARGSGD